MNVADDLCDLVELAVSAKYFLPYRYLLYLLDRRVAVDCGIGQYAACAPIVVDICLVV
jgi:hypothetical protein